jgi:predicted NBD/HSP70 family sugar kinase
MLSDGVGAGLVLDGRLYEGFTGRAGEFGHVTVMPNGYVCRCGNRGCLETVAGARALIEALTLTRGGRTTLPDVIALARAGDPGVRRVMADAGRAIGVALAPYAPCSTPPWSSSTVKPPRLALHCWTPCAALWPAQ